MAGFLCLGMGTLLSQPVLDVQFQIVNIGLFLRTSLLQQSKHVKFLSFALFCLQCFPHAVSYRTFVDCLIGLDRHFDFVSHTHQQKSSFGAVDGALTN